MNTEGLTPRGTLENSERSQTIKDPHAQLQEYKRQLGLSPDLSNVYKVHKRCFFSSVNRNRGQLRWDATRARVMWQTRRRSEGVIFCQTGRERCKRFKIIIRRNHLSIKGEVLGFWIPEQVKYIQEQDNTRIAASPLSGSLKLFVKARDIALPLMFCAASEKAFFGFILGAKNCPLRIDWQQSNKAIAKYR